VRYVTPRSAQSFDHDLPHRGHTLQLGSAHKRLPSVFCIVEAGPHLRDRHAANLAAWLHVWGIPSASAVQAKFQFMRPSDCDFLIGERGFPAIL
jgi:hypothetical protein